MCLRFSSDHVFGRATCIVKKANVAKINIVDVEFWEVALHISIQAILLVHRCRPAELTVHALVEVDFQLLLVLLLSLMHLFSKDFNLSLQFL